MFVHVSSSGIGSNTPHVSSSTAHYDDAPPQQSPKRTVFLAAGKSAHGLALSTAADANAPSSLLLQVQTVPSTTFSYTALPLQTGILGCFGCRRVGDDIFVGFVTEAIPVAACLPIASYSSAHHHHPTIYRVTKVAFYSISSSRYDNWNAGGWSDATTDEEDTSSAMSGTLDSSLEDASHAAFTHPCAALIKLLSSGTFYFCSFLDLTKTMQGRSNPSASLHNNESSQFSWSANMLAPLIPFETEEMQRSGDCLIRSLICGFVGTRDVYLGNAGQIYHMGIISRVSTGYAGTRFNARGINDDGDVSNFVQTEFFVIGPSIHFSFVQVRGSVPLFWEQTGVQLSAHKIEISRGIDASLPAQRLHFQRLKDTYGPREVHIINLLSKSKSSPEAALSTAYMNSACNHPGISITEFDYHSIIKRDSYDRISELIIQLLDVLDSQGYYLALSDRGNACHPQLLQTGIIRTNCLDCLDRTNVVQTAIAKDRLLHVLTQVLRIPMGDGSSMYYSSAPSLPEPLNSLFNSLWADNGDALSFIYTGTGALKSSLTRQGKATLFGFFDDAAKAVNRFLVNTFQDKGKQGAIDLLLGKGVERREFDASSDGRAVVLPDTLGSGGLSTSGSKLKIFVGTWNVNGFCPNSATNLNGWLNFKGHDPHLIVIGIQEMIKLTAEQYISADTDKLRSIWEGKILSLLSMQSKTYVSLRSSHLVALALFIFVQKDHVHMIRNLDVATKRTGLGGIAANKGGVGMGFTWGGVHTFSFITAHFAAGSSAVEERNRDFRTLESGLIVRKGGDLPLREHDYVCWLGDFNYRVNLSNVETRTILSERRPVLAPLIEQDQLKQQQGGFRHYSPNLSGNGPNMSNPSSNYGGAFEGYQEGPLTFPPTYKYDTGSDLYDTSEKARTPSWTDRILYKCNLVQSFLSEQRSYPITLLNYSRCEVYYSDHRPVQAILEYSVHQQGGPPLPPKSTKPSNYTSSNGPLPTSSYLTTRRNEHTLPSYNPFIPVVQSAVESNSGPKVGTLIDLAESSTLAKPSTATFNWWDT